MRFADRTRERAPISLLVFPVVGAATITSTKSSARVASRRQAADDAQAVLPFLPCGSTLSRLLLAAPPSTRP
uniref:Predicted protein n=1 Tax=Hordeum vulgare subsp. vulgare TaxID=112509 RepID=F2DWG7_HORVV|nr:predicted protein [Hordeum vulgare subsp. vulgare]